MRIPTYIGRFTPAGGGITGKNKAVYDALSAETTIKQIDLTLIKRGSIKTLARAIRALCARNGTLIIGTAAKMRRTLSLLLYIFNRKTMNNSLLMVMGGQFGNIVAADKAYQKWVKQYKMLYVETHGMKNALNAVGITNVSVFPNCRVKPSTDITTRPCGDTLKCVCFSMIYPEKGIDTVLDAAEQLQNVSFHFWGPIREDYEKEFLATVRSLQNCTYHGVFQVDGDNVYDLLNQYDLLLFPTRCTGEGVPGTLIEAKIAALPAIVSNVAYNAELVNDRTEGIVLKENTAEALVAAICELKDTPELLNQMKSAAKISGESYYFDSYIPHITAVLEGKK